VIESFRVRRIDAALSSQLSRHAAHHAVLEVGTHSPWVSRASELLARLGRVDP
jgi:hypothetical protein